MTSFTSHERVTNQAGVQTIHGNVNYFSESNNPTNFRGHFSNSSLRPVANYVARPSLQQKIKEQLHGVLSDNEQDTRILVIYGLGGSGKSQLALNFVHTCRGDYASIFWIEAGQKETIERDFLTIYRLLFSRLSAGSELPTVEEAVTMVKSWFYGQSGRFLVIFDSADTVDDADEISYIDLNYFIPNAPCVDVIITTRSSQTQGMTSLEAVEVADMEPAEAAELFRNSAKLTQTGLDVEKEIMLIVQELGYLALAITLAGSYVATISRLRSDIRSYLPEYRERRKQLLGMKAKKLIHRYGESVLSTWETSFAAVARQSGMAARLLSLLAFLNFDDIFPALFERPAGEWQSYLSPDSPPDSYTVEVAFGVLQTYLLIQWRDDQAGYAMHKLVHAWGQDRLGMEQRRHLSLMALELLTNIIPKTGNSIFGMRLVPHIMANFAMVSGVTAASATIHGKVLDSISVMSGLLYNLGRWSDQCKVQAFHFRRMCASAGTKHPSTLTSMNNLATVLRNQGKYEEAEEMHRQVLGLRETVLGKEDPDILTSMNNLALVLGDQGKYKQAEEMHRQALGLYKTVLGKEHPDTLTSVNNLALVLSDQGKYEEAEEMHRETFGLRETVLGKEHPDTLRSMNNLATVLGDQGKYEEAEKMHRQALGLKETVLGKEHPSTLTSMNNLAGVLRDQGKYEEAEEMHRQELGLCETVLGKEHPDTLTSIYSLAYVLSKRKRFSEADPLYQRALNGYKNTLAPDHPTIQACRNHYSGMLEEMQEDIGGEDIMSQGLRADGLES